MRGCNYHFHCRIYLELISCLVNKMPENGGKCPLVSPKAWDDVLKMSCFVHNQGLIEKTFKRLIS